jgi:hypothetical protein
MKIALIVLLVLQAIALAGPVCGTHLTTAESMDCCQKGHNHDSAGMRDDHATACCSTCGTGKVQLLKQQESIQPALDATVELVSVEILVHPADKVEFSEGSVSPSPPDIFLFDRSLRI